MQSRLGGAIASTTVHAIDVRTQAVAPPTSSESQRSADELVDAGKCINTERSYRAALRYWCDSGSLSDRAIAEVVKRRAARAGLQGDWSGHSLRSGYATEAGRRGIPLADTMAMTDHRNVNTVIDYQRAGELVGSRAAKLANLET